jgi:hypothetical protein
MNTPEISPNCKVTDMWTLIHFVDFDTHISDMSGETVLTGFYSHKFRGIRLYSANIFENC